MLASGYLGRGGVCLCSDDVRKGGAQGGSVLIEAAVMARGGGAARTDGLVVGRENPFRVSFPEDRRDSGVFADEFRHPKDGLAIGPEERELLSIEARS